MLLLCGLMLWLERVQKRGIPDKFKLITLGFLLPVFILCELLCQVFHVCKVF